MDRLTRQENTPKKFNQRSAEQIGQDFAVSGNDAIRIAATTMDGADTTASGGLHASQTYCNVLHYNESLPESAGKADGKALAEENLGIFLKENQKFAKYVQEHGIKLTTENLTDIWLAFSDSFNTS